MRAILLRTLVLGVTVGAMGCGESEGTSPTLSGVGGGTSAIPGNGSPSVGGAKSGGNTKASTGPTASSTGGAKGGVGPTSGSSITSGGAVVVGAGGAIGKDTSSLVGPITKGGATSTGWPPFGRGGSVSSGGSVGTTGPTTKGGSSSTAPTSTPPITTTCTEAEVKACAKNDTNSVAKHCGLTYEIWTKQAEGCMVNTAKGFRAEWTTDTNNYLARKGVRPGSSSPVVTYSADYKPNGNSYLGIYGWTKNPLIEYYIVDSWGNWRPPGGTSLGTVQSDGGTYDIYRTQRKNESSIEGIATFYQFWSVRKEKRESGTITVAPHFEAWKAFDLTMGTFYEVSLVVEGYGSSGSADVTVSFK